MQSSIREEDANEIAKATLVKEFSKEFDEAASEARKTAFLAARSMLQAQLNSYKPDTVRAQVVRKSISDLNDLMSAIEEVATSPAPVHSLVGKPCPSCGRAYAARSAGGVVCQNGHTRP